jgi:hypothetical protein
VNVIIAKSVGTFSKATFLSEHISPNTARTPRNNYSINLISRDANHAKEINVIFVKYATNLNASRLVLRLFLRRRGSAMMHAVIYVANTSRTMPNTKGGKNGDATKRSS